MKSDTKVVVSGRHPERFEGAVNPPVFRISTIVANTMEEWHQLESPNSTRSIYGRLGSPTTSALEEAVAELEGAHKGFLYSSGLAANVGAILPFVNAGDHVMMTDSIYGPVRRFAMNVLKRMDIETTFFPSGLGGAEFKALFRPNTRVVYLESPGSLSMDMQDVPMLTEIAKAAGARVVIDNTWATPLYFNPLSHGVDVSIHSATKYIVGHSDVMMGILAVTEEVCAQVRSCRQDFGQITSPDDAYLAQRGLRTMHVRLERHGRTGLKLAEWLCDQPEVEKVLHPALPGDAGHAIWKRDFKGTSGLFSFVFKPIPDVAQAAFVDAMPLFSIGASWGGYESLILPVHPEKVRTAEPWPYEGPTFRINAGLEDVDDLLDNLKAGFAALRRVM